MSSAKGSYKLHNCLNYERFVTIINNQIHGINENKGHWNGIRAYVKKISIMDYRRTPMVYSMLICRSCYTEIPNSPDVDYVIKRRRNHVQAYCIACADQKNIPYDKSVSYKKKTQIGGKPSPVITYA